MKIIEKQKIHSKNHKISHKITKIINILNKYKFNNKEYNKYNFNHSNNNKIKDFFLISKISLAVINSKKIKII